MTKLLPMALMMAAAMAIPGSAEALDSNKVFTVSILNAHSQEKFAGHWYFSLDADKAESCSYAVEWESPSGLISTDCLFEEMKSHGRRSCIRNAQKSFPTIVTLDEYGEGCQGFAGDTGLMEDVAMLVMGEGPLEMNGVILFDSPLGAVHSIVARVVLPPSDPPNRE